MNTYEYWIGENVDYDGIWNAFDSGSGYIQKFRSMRVHLIEITIRQPSIAEPLFNHDVVYKTIKGYFHDLKKLCLSSAEYQSAGPLFLYEVKRGSGIWAFLGELRQLITFGTTLADEKVVGEKLANLDRRIEFLRKHFGNAVCSEDFKMFMRAKTPRQLERAVQRLIEQGIERVTISETHFTGDADSCRATAVDVKALLQDADRRD